MRFKVQVVVEADEDATPVVREVFAFDRGDLGPASVGLALDEAKDLLGALQEAVVTEQVNKALAEKAPCPTCGRPRRHKDSRQIVLRSLFGTLHLRSPRWLHCSCSQAPTRAFTPLADLLAERATPELLYLEAKFAGLVSYGASAKLLSEVLPLGRALHATAVRRHVHAVAERLEAELGDERRPFVEGCPRDWAELPRPDLPITVGLDGGFVHSANQTSRRDGWFEVIAGKAIPAEGPARSFGYVQTYDQKPRRRLFNLLTSLGLQTNQQITFLTDGADDVRDLPRYLNPEAEYLLDWFHITMRLTVLGQMAKAPAGVDLVDKRGPWCEDLEDDDLRHLQEDLDRVPHQLERLKWFCWHGNVFRALQLVDDLTFDLEVVTDAGPEYTKLHKALCEFRGYIAANASSIPNYGERYRAGERISTGFAESAINQVVAKRMVKRQQMRWSPRGAHLLLQVRTRVLDDTLADDFHRWYPDFAHQHEQSPAMAA